MNGDVLSNINFTDFYDFAVRKKTSLTVCVKKIIMPYAFGNIFFEDDLVVGIEEKPDIITYALAGIYIMQPEILELFPIMNITVWIL